MTTTKKCTKCFEVKAMDAFYAHKRGKYGRAASCKDCERKYYEENKVRRVDYGRKYRKENKYLISVKRRSTDQNYYRKNKGTIVEKIKKYRQKNPEVHRQALRKRRALKRSLPHAPLTPAQYERLYEFRDQVFGEVTS